MHKTYKELFNMLVEIKLKCKLKTTNVMIFSYLTIFDFTHRHVLIDSLKKYHQQNITSIIQKKPKVTHFCFKSDK